MSVTQSDINSLLSMITVRLSENNFVKWSFQFKLVLEGNDLFTFFDGTSCCPDGFIISEDGTVTSTVSLNYKQWKMCDKALLSLLMATLDDDVMDIIVGTKSAREAWLALCVKS